MDLSPTLPASLQLAGEWFLRSGIQEPSGGVARYYLVEPSRNARVSTEISGYALSALVYLHRKTGESAFLGAARRAAEFLERHAWDAGLAIYPFEHSVNGDLPRNLAYFFDSGIIARGLLAIWRATGEERWLAAAVRGGESMVRDFLRERAVDPILELPRKTALPHAGSWSRNPGCYQLKSALAWRDLHDATGEPDFLAAYERVLAWSLASQDGFLPGADEQPLVMDRLHAYCYFLEGMLPCYERAECRLAVRAGLARVARHLREIGPVFQRSDVAAQLLRARLYADALGAEVLDAVAAAEEADIIKSYQREDSDTRIHGGYWFGRKAGELLPYVNPVSTAFCLQAAEMWRERQAGEFRADRYELI